MQTVELIEKLAGSAAPVRKNAVVARLALSGAVGTAVAVLLMLVWLPARPDLQEFSGTPRFWLKLAYAAALGLAGWMAIERLSRPAGSGRRGLFLALAALAALTLLGGAQLAMAAPDERVALWMGVSWRECPFNILGLSVPILAAGLWGVRSLAPTRLVLAGAATGLFAAGVGAVVYGLHCIETEPAFVGTWYSLGVALVTALGAILGPLVLRWR